MKKGEKKQKPFAVDMTDQQQLSAILPKKKAVFKKGLIETKISRDPESKYSKS